MDERSAVSKRILLVDPDEPFGTTLRNVLGPDYTVLHLASIKDAVPLFLSDEIDVALLDWDQPSRTNHSDCLEALKATQELSVPPAILGFTCDSRRETAMEALRHGAWDFFVQPLDIGTMKFALARAHSRTTLLRELAAARGLVPAEPIEGLMGNSKPMERVRGMIRKVAGVSTTVLLTGESGTGKEVVARTIHQLSPRAQKPFVAFSVSALSESLIEDELFGHEKGAFTGAAQFRRGRFEEAKGGTIFLDEFGDLALPLQGKLLRVLQERSLERLGSNAVVPVDIRIICATNRKLEEMVQEGTFRQDLYFRVSVLKIELPPLRSRVEDIAVLAEYFLRQFTTKHGKYIRGISPGYLNAMTGHEWPGNVRELQNVIERSVVLAEGQHLGIEDLPPELRPLAVAAEIPRGAFQEAVRNFKRELVRSALRLSNGNKLKAAQELSISRCYLHRLLNQLNIEDTVRMDEEFATDDQFADNAPTV